MISGKSPNFGFLSAHGPLLVQVAAGAERYCLSDPVASLTKQRLLAELLARQAAAYAAVPDDGLDQADRIDLLAGRALIAPEVRGLFDSIRRAGNRAVHDHVGTASDALHHLKLLRQLAIWFHRSFSTEPDFRPGPFVPPPDPKAAEEGLRDELERLRRRLADIEDEADQYREDAERHRALTAEQARRLAEAEEQARQAYEEMEAALELAEDIEAERIRFEAEVEALRAERAAEPEVVIERAFAQAQQAGSRVDLDEWDTRRLIDEQLRAAGWEADTARLRYSKGTRPQKGRNLAIAEWPTENGPADYVLFAGLVPLAVVEAKRRSKNVAADIGQAERYSRGYVVRGEEELPPGGPWDGGAEGALRIPFLFATNGRPYLKQIETKSGIWFRDGRRPTNHPRALQGWYSPEGLEKLLAQDVAAAEKALAEQPVDLPGLRYYQRDAVEAVEEAVRQGQQAILLAMATGTGKTRTALALLYRLVKHKRFRRILFLVDRTALGEQALGAFEEVKLEGALSFADTYDVKALGDLEVESDTRVHLATVQSLVKRVLAPEDGARVPPVDQYDCVVVDECHRGYVLDRELSDTELTFRSQAEYVSKYRRVMEYFDAVRIGLTATPALHTVEIFGRPVYAYSYRQAVIDGYLVDHLPPTRIVTKLAEDGIHWRVGEEVHVYDPGTGQIDLTTAPDEIDVEVDQFNRVVVTENFNQAVIGHIVREVDPSLPGKTLVFCVNDDHADLVVKVFKEEFERVYGPIRDDVVAKITGAADRPGALIRHFRNEEHPKVAVTVDLLTTGIDVLAIVNLVFLRRVKSRILYEQMLGRATRPCPDLYGPGAHKEFFRVFDAVDLYSALQDYTEMKPVVTEPTVTFAQLAGELGDLTKQAAPDGVAIEVVLDQLLTRLQQKRGALEAHPDAVEARTGMRPGALLAHVRDGGRDAARALFESDPDLAAFLDGLRQERSQRQLVSLHDDEVVRVKTGYGDGNERPEDYLEGFGAWIRSHLNEIPALVAVVQRPRELTRQQLKELALELDRAGFNELRLRSAWRETRNEDIAATIIGFIRTQALGSPLVPYAERVDRALRRILASHAWTAPQAQWLRRIAQQVKENVVVDPEALDRDPFRRDGGFRRLDRVFDGRLRDVLADLQEEVWQDAA